MIQLFLYQSACEAPKDKYDYDSDGCRWCDCVSSVTCPKFNCVCPAGTHYDLDINGCPTCQCISGKMCHNNNCLTKEES